MRNSLKIAAIDVLLFLAPLIVAVLFVIATT